VVVEPQQEQPTGSSNVPQTPKPQNASSSDRENKDQPPKIEKGEKQKKKSNAEKLAERHAKKPLKPPTDGNKSPKPSKQSKTPDRKSKSPAKVVCKPPGGSSKIVLFVSYFLASRTAKLIPVPDTLFASRNRRKEGEDGNCYQACSRLG
jgi:FtsZ-interacting cell division protein ZipA